MKSIKFSEKKWPILIQVLGYNTILILALKLLDTSLGYNPIKIDD